jgi:PadR family transcriptional regulator PadR
MRLTHATVQVAIALMSDQAGQHWGYELSKQAKVRSGAMYPILGRMLDEGWLTDGWEDEADTGGNRPPRRYYELTDRGRHELGALLADAAADGRFAMLPGLAL